jgi:hypothetical protein
MSNVATSGKFVLVRVEGANDDDVFKAVEQMGLWTPPNVKLYDKRDNTGVFVYARFYFKTVTVPTPAPQRPPVQQPQPNRTPPRVVNRGTPQYNVKPAPTATDYDDSEDREYQDQTGGRRPF